MILGGLWHGAAWNFVLWGAFHGAILVLYRLFDRNPEHLDPWSGNYSYLRIFSKMILMFALTNIGWVLFRSTSIQQIGYIFTHLSFQRSENSFAFLKDCFFLSTPLLVVQIFQYCSRDLLVLTKLKGYSRAIVYALILVLMAVYGYREPTEFIYFQF